MQTTPSSRTFTCDGCSAAFAGDDGGICAECGRTLCGRCLDGWRWYVRGLVFSEGWRLRQPRCTRCRRGAGG